MNLCASGLTMRQFALDKLRQLLEGAGAAIQQASETPSPDAIHKMRASIRRLQQALRLFRQFIPAKGLSRVRAELRGLMKRAGEARNHDIAIQLLKRAGQKLPELAARRVATLELLRAELARLPAAGAGVRWAAVLELDRDQKALER